MQARKSIVMQWNYILLMVHYLVLVMLNARLCDFSFLGWLLVNLFASLHFALSMITNCASKTFKPILPHESSISTYMRYSFVVLSKFVCVISNFQNKFRFCVPVPLMKRQGVAIIFHARCVILKMSVYSLAIAWEYDGNRDA